MGRNARNTIIEVSDADSCVMDLNEGNVQAIFERCLAKEDSKEGILSEFTSTIIGFKEDEVGLVTFDKNEFFANKRKINYLFGQLQAVHTKSQRLSVLDFLMVYSGKKWTTDRITLMKLLYLGATEEQPTIDFFEPENFTTSIYPIVKPTLSPKDPAFPEWWEQHKAEWEQYAAEWEL